MGSWALGRGAEMNFVLLGSVAYSFCLRFDAAGQLVQPQPLRAHRTAPFFSNRSLISYFCLWWGGEKLILLYQGWDTSSSLSFLPFFMWC